MTMDNGLDSSRSRNVPGLGEFIKRASETILALGIVMSALTGCIYVFGGRVPPWVTPAEAQAMQDTQRQTIDALQKLTGTVDKLASRVDRKDCNEFNARYWRAWDALQKSREDQIAKDALKAARDRILDTAGCSIDVVDRR